MPRASRPTSSPAVRASIPRQSLRTSWATASNAGRSRSVATFYNRYHGLRSLEKASPTSPLVIGNGQDGESFGAELTAEYWLTNRWRVGAGYTELRVHIWANPGSTDTSRGASESHTP